jgi:DNA polymerase III delta prime subunit
MKKYEDWADFKYKPKSFDEVLGNKVAIDLIKGYIKHGNMTHTLLCGEPGRGKSVVAELLAIGLGAEYRIWNSSVDRRLPVIQKQVIGFAGTKSIDKPLKVAILDECDRFTKDSQNSLRAPMVNYSENCKFILISNQPDTINKWVLSRCQTIKFNKIPTKDIFDRLEYIVGEEKLFSIISEDQIRKISEIADGDMRIAIKTLQGLCDGRFTPVQDGEIYIDTSDTIKNKVGQSLTSAFRGDLSTAMVDMGEVLRLTKPAQIFKIILSNIAYSKFSDEQKITLGMGLRGLSYDELSSHYQVYGYLAYVCANRGA